MKTGVQFLPVGRVTNEILRRMKEPPLEKAAEVQPESGEGTAPFDLLYGGGLRLLAGRPAMGKTVLALQAAMACARCGEKVFFITVKETPEKLISYMTQTNGMPHFYAPGALPGASPRGAREIRTALSEISALPIFLARADCASLPDLLALVPDGDALIFNGMQDLFSMYAKPGAYAPTEKALQAAALRASSALVTVGVKRAVERRKDRVPRPGDLRCTAAFRESAEPVYTLYRAGYYACSDDPASLLRAYDRNGKTVDHPLIYSRDF